jgi:hypothetical protein
MEFYSRKNIQQNLQSSLLLIRIIPLGRVTLRANRGTFRFTGYPLMPTASALYPNHI